MLLRKSFAVGLLALGSSLLTQSAQATDLPGLVNLNFLDYTGSAPKDYFTNVKPVGWSGGSGLIFIDTPGTDPTSPTTACGPTYLSTYGCPSTLAIPGGYNEVEADGNPIFASGFNYSVSGLTAGTTYTLSFYQAASQQRDFTGDTTEQWIVALGQSGFTVHIGAGPFDPVFGSFQSTFDFVDPTTSFAATPLMHTPSGGMTDWNFVSVDLAFNPVDPTTTSALLSFLAWGNDGTTANLPPMVFLTGVNSQPGLVTPEPSTVVLSSTVLLGLGLMAWRRRRAVKA